MNANNTTRSTILILVFCGILLITIRSLSTFIYFQNDAELLLNRSGYSYYKEALKSSVDISDGKVNGEYLIIDDEYINIVTGELRTLETIKIVNDDGTFTTENGIVRTGEYRNIYDAENGKFVCLGAYIQGLVGRNIIENSIITEDTLREAIDYDTFWVMQK